MPRSKSYKRRVQARTAGAMARGIASRLSKAPQLPKKWKAPSSPDEARKWLQAVADHLIEMPNARLDFLFVAYALKKYLRDPQAKDLYKEFGLAPPDSKRGRGRPQVALVKVRGIAKMLAEGADIPTIKETFPSVSKTIVELIRADYHALTFTISFSHRMDDGDVRDREWREALRRAHGVRPEWREAIILGISDAILFDSLVDPVDPANTFAPQQVDPQHKPVLVRGTLK